MKTRTTNYEKEMITETIMIMTTIVTMMTKKRKRRKGSCVKECINWYLNSTGK